MIEYLPPHPDARPPDRFAGPDQPIRKVTRQVAFEDAWDRVRAAKIATLFDSLASNWATEHVEPTKAAPVVDALERGGLDLSGWWLELGSGTGAGTRVLAPRVERLVACDLAAKMLAEAPSDLVPHIRADAGCLPFPDARFDVVLMVNMLLFPQEVDRVLADDGAVVWVNTHGDQTPIHLPVEDVARALPGRWHGVSANAGTGFWAVYRRS